MKFKLIIDKEQPESVLVTAHAPSALTRQIEDLVRQQENEDRLSGYSEEKDEFCMLPLSRIQCITVRGGKNLCRGRRRLPVPAEAAAVRAGSHSAGLFHSDQ